MKNETQKGMTSEGERIDVEVPNIGRPGCANCAFAILSVDGASNKVAGFECRRYAPRPGQLSAWPDVRPDDWCGQYMSRREFAETESAKRESLGVMRLLRDTFSDPEGGSGKMNG